MAVGKSLFSKKSNSDDELTVDTTPLDGQPLVLGIDLGTTHTVLARGLESEHHGPSLTIEPVQQTAAQGMVKTLPHLPSFLYMPGSELDQAQLALPWSETPEYLTGTYARELAAKTPGRAIHSAKSWLSHQHSNPKNETLPLHPAEGIAQISAYTASKEYLRHLQKNWDFSHPEVPFHEQDIVLTVPASFDPAARELTAEAAKELGLQHLTLLEEPQAATYAWIADHQESWRDQLQVGDRILVVDVGGGTTDLSLIKVFEEDGDFGLERIAVGDHILLGGDNMDLALAYRLSQQLATEGTQLKPWQILGMNHSCREAKEALFANPDLESAAVVVPGRGSKLIGGTVKTQLSRALLNECLIEGFFPKVSHDARPQQSTRSGLQQIGLNYAQDTAITRHIAAFLDQQNDKSLLPTALLLNGGVFKASVLSARLLETLNSWADAIGAPAVRLLDGCDLDAAVARGAAYYALVRRGKGLRIRGGLASAFYIGIESSMPAIPGMPAPMQALCVAPFGMEEGEAIDTIKAQTFGLLVGESVSFRFFSSNSRKDDQAGDILDDWEDGELTVLPDIQATVPVTLGKESRTQGEVVPVVLGTRISELGTLEVLACPVSGGEPWKIQLDVRETIS